MDTNGDGRDNDDVRATLRDLLAESEGLLAALGEEGTQRYRGAVVGMQRQIRRARDDLDDDSQYSALRRARVAARLADEYAHTNPWKTASATAAVGAAVGVAAAILIARR